MTKDEFIVEVEKLGIIINEEKLSKLEKYYNLLIEWNNKINLTRITDKEEVYLKHFYDSLTLYKAYDLTKKVKVLDVGTGAGFPGIVLKIFFDDLDITLIDSLNKRITFLQEVIQKLNLKNIKAIHERAEVFSKNNIEKFDIITSRAVAKLNILNEIVVPALKINGYFIPMKAHLKEELDESLNSIQKLNCSLENVITFNLPKENSIRNLVVIKKISSTDEKYPRKFEQIKKNPI